MATKQQNWKLKLEAQRDLRRQGASLIRQRVALLIEIELDEQFLEWCDAQGVASRDELDKELDDVGFDFVTLKKVYEETDEAAWKRTSLRMLVADVLGKQKKERTKEAVSWKERCLKAEKECERLRGMVDVLTARVSEQDKVIALLASRSSLAEVG